MAKKYKKAKEKERLKKKELSSLSNLMEFSEAIHLARLDIKRARCFAKSSMTDG